MDNTLWRLNCFTALNISILVSFVQVDCMRILVTGAAGFIGSELCIKLLEGETVIGVDNHNDYYDPALKEARLSRHSHINYTHLRLEISDREDGKSIFKI